MSQRLCIFGEVLFDVFPDGNQVLGGAPFNVAWHLQAFGQNPQLISRVGSDQQGELIRQAMIGWGMNTQSLQTDSTLPTGRVNIELQHGEPVYDIVSPCAYDAIDASLITDPACDFLYHGSLALRQEPSFQALQHILNAGPSCLFVDVNLRPPWWEKSRVLSLIEKAHWVKLNIDEFDLLFPGSETLSTRLSSFIRQFQLQAAILTHGAQGAEVVRADGERFIVAPGRDVEVVDTVGAGDSFTAVMILGLLNQWPMQLTLERAQVMASSIVSRQGATVPDPLFYNNLLNEWLLEEH